MKVIIVTLLLAMVPISEVRGAIPYAVVQGIPVPWDFLVPVLGNIFVVPWLLLLLEPFFRWLWAQPSLERLKQWVAKYQTRTVSKVTQHRRTIMVALFLFVAVPLPSTGAYSGALAAVLLRLPKRQSFLVISLGVVVAGIIVYLTTKGIFRFF